MNNAYFFHSRDTNLIEIGKETGEKVKIPLEIFLKFEPEYRLPGGIKSQKYVLGIKHSMVSDSLEKPTTFYLGNTWSDGDRYIQRFNEFANIQEFESNEIVTASITSSMVKDKLVPKQLIPKSFSENVAKAKKKRS